MRRYGDPPPWSFCSNIGADLLLTQSLDVQRFGNKAVVGRRQHCSINRRNRAGVREGALSVNRNHRHRCTPTGSLEHGAIASSTDPRALALFRNVMLASAGISGAFSPVMIDVEVKGKAYQEMHVDGGAPKAQ
jgi:hypothetical protein